MATIDDRLEALESKTKEFAEGEAKYNAAYRALISRRDELDRREHALEAREAAAASVDAIQGQMEAMAAQHQVELNNLRNELAAERSKTAKRLEVARQALAG